MVDCDFFTQYNQLLIIQSNRVLLDSKNTEYTIEMQVYFKVRLFSTQECQKIAKCTSNNFNTKTPIKAVYGIVDMEINRYLAVITKAAVIGQIYHRKIYQVQKVQFICLNYKQSSTDTPYITKMRQMLQSKNIYFSDEYDLTNSLQEFINSGYSMKNRRLQYMYNQIWVQDFVKIKAYEWITGFISGFISVSFTHAGTNFACELGIITRRDKRRQGMRWLTRGTDLDGNTANTAQTQSIFLAQSNGKQETFSYVQLRGSIPFLWKQTPDLKWAPKCTINPNDKLNTQITKKNYDDIKKHYQNCTLLNLIDKKGSQKRMGEYFDRMHNSVADSAFRLVWFDFHAQCKNMKYENLARLLDIIANQVQNYGYFHMQSQASSRKIYKDSVQKGIFRTNCMDCLDRTNVVQSVLARQLLLKWLFRLQIMNKPRNLSAFQKLPQSMQQIFRDQWTRNADQMSILYSGTPAMKTDFTATGKRTFNGSVKDGKTGVTRFFLGNFYDNRKQDYIDFCLGKIKPLKSKQDKIRHSSFNSLYLMALIMLIVPFLVYHQVDANTTEDSPKGLMTTGISIVVLALVAKSFQLMKSVFLRQPIRNGNY